MGGRGDTTCRPRAIALTVGCPSLLSLSRTNARSTGDIEILRYRPLCSSVRQFHPQTESVRSEDVNRTSHRFVQQHDRPRSTREAYKTLACTTTLRRGRYATVNRRPSPFGTDSRESSDACSDRWSYGACLWCCDTRTSR